jgi:hypothetical protein
VKSAVRKKPEWLKPYHFQKGKSGNPSGGHGDNALLITRIKELTGDGVEMVDAIVRIMRGEILPGFKWPPKYETILEASIWLAERYFGKAPLQLQNSNGENIDLLKIIYVELSKAQKEQGGTFDLKPEHTIDAEWTPPPPGQDLADQQPIQNPIQDGSSTVQAKSASD